MSNSVLQIKWDSKDINKNIKLYTKIFVKLDQKIFKVETDIFKGIGENRRISFCNLQKVTKLKNEKDKLINELEWQIKYLEKDIKYLKKTKSYDFRDHVLSINNLINLKTEIENLIIFEKSLQKSWF